MSEDKELTMEEFRAAEAGHKQPEVKIDILDWENHKDDEQWNREAQILLKLYAAAPKLYDMLYTIQQCYGHDWKQRHQDQVGVLLKND